MEMRREEAHLSARFCAISKEASGKFIRIDKRRVFFHVSSPSDQTFPQVSLFPNASYFSPSYKSFKMGGASREGMQHAFILKTPLTDPQVARSSHSSPQRRKRRSWTRKISLSRRSSKLVCVVGLVFVCSLLTVRLIDAKAKKDMLDAAKGKKGPLNTGQQGIKKSGKK